MNIITWYFFIFFPIFFYEVLYLFVFIFFFSLCYDILMFLDVFINLIQVVFHLYFVTTYFTKTFILFHNTTFFELFLFDFRYLFSIFRYLILVLNIYFFILNPTLICLFWFLNKIYAYGQFLLASHPHI